MSSSLNPARRKAVLFAAASGCLAGVPALMSRGSHHVAFAVCITVQICLLVAAGVQLKKGMKDEGAQR